MDWADRVGGVCEELAEGAEVGVVAAVWGGWVRDCFSN